MTYRRLATLFVSLFWASVGTAQYSFTGLGIPASGTPDSWGIRASTGGGTVAGQAGSRAAVWNPTGPVWLTQLAGETSSIVWGVSSSGSVAAGVSNGPSGARAVRWSGSLATDLGILTGGVTASSFGISGDGLVIVGQSDSLSGQQATRWTASGGLVGLGDFAGGGAFSRANGTNYDGSVVVGEGTSASGTDAFRWTASTGMVALGDLAGGAYYATAAACSADGTVIAGTSIGTSGHQAFRWTSGTGLVGLGDLPGGVFRSRAYSCSADGNVIVGTSEATSGATAFLWTPSTGMVSLKTYLANNGVSTGTWQLTAAWGVSADGGTIVGIGLNPSSQLEGFKATLPGATPPTAVDDAGTVNTNGTLTVSAPGVLANDLNASGGTALLVTAPAHAAAFSLGADGSYTYQPAAGYIGADSFTYRVFKGGLTSGTATVSLTVRATLTSLTVAPTSVQGGASVTATVALGGQAPAGGTAVALSDTSSAVDSEGASPLTVPAGADTGSTSIGTSAVATDTGVTITANLQNGTATRTASLTVLAIQLGDLTLQASSVIGGTSVGGQVSLSSATPSQVSVALQSNHAAAQVPASATVAAGAASAGFTVATSSVASSVTATITATFNGGTDSASLVINPPGLSSLGFAPSTVYGGLSSTGTVTLGAAAPAGGATVTLSSPTPNAFFPNGSTLVVPAGATSATFIVQTLAVPSDTTYTLSATRNAQTVSATLRLLTTPTLSAFAISPTAVYEGYSTTGTLTLSRAAPTGGAVVTLAAVETGSALILPESVKVPAGATTKAFSIVTRASGPSPLVRSVSATYGGTTRTASVTINPIFVSAFSATPLTLTGGDSITATVTLSVAAAPRGTTVSVFGGNKLLVTSPVLVPGGQKTLTFTVPTSQVSVKTSQKLTVGRNGVSFSKLVTLHPVTIQ